MTAFDVAVSTVRRWRDQPCQFVVENFGVEPDAWQAEALNAFASPDPTQRRIALQAATGPGKSAVLAWCGLHFLATRGDRHDHPKGAAVSVTSANLRDNLWAELSKWQNRSEFLRRAFTWTASRIFQNDHPETWFLSARSWPKSASPDEQGKTLSGLHSKFVFALIDESGGIPVTVLRAAEQALSNCAFGKIVQAGNPISLEGMLYAAATNLRHLWHVIRVTGDPDDPKRSPRIDLTWAREQIAAYGRENPWVASYILGHFPTASINALFDLEEVEAAMARKLPPESYEWSQKRLGIDVARFGDDRTVIFPRQGLQAFRPVQMRHGRGSAVSVDIANRVLAAKAKWGSDVELADGTGGWSAGFIDVLRSQGFTPIDVQFAAPAFDPKYRNRRAEIWFGMSQWLQRGGGLPNVRELVAELVSVTYSFSNGKFVLEEKDQVKKRIGRSPDLADALALTFGLPDMPREMAAGAHGSVGHAITEFDPFAQDMDAERARAHREFDRR